MNDYSPHTPLSYETARPLGSVRADERQGVLTLGAFLVVVAAFAVYLLSAVYLDARDGIAYFGADSDHYSVMADQGVHYRAARFHPATIALGLGWMKVFSPLAAWIAPHVLLKALFAAIGAAGVLAAISACAAVLPRGYALLGGMLYASSLGVWYFAAIPESKILTATLSTIYIAAYIQLREQWTLARAVGLTAILAVACLNEVVSAGLVAIPLIDALLRRGFDWRGTRWLAAHILVALVAWFVLEVFVNGGLIPESKKPELQSHWSMLLHYIASNDYGLATLHGFVANWFFFNIASPTPHALWWPEFGGYFEPSLAAYRWSLIGVCAFITLAFVCVAGLLPRYRAAHLGPEASLLLPLAAFALARAAIFLVFNPFEPLLFSPAVTLAHWLIVLVPFAASRFPAKRAVLVVLCVLLIVANAGFMVGPDGWPALWARITGA